MSGVIEEISAGDGASDRHDEALQNLLAQHGDDPVQLLATVFGFLQRNTGFLAANDAQRRVTAVLRRTMGLPDASASSGVKAGFLGAAKPVGDP
jgi:N-terminal conserved domain of Nudc.